MNVALFLKAHAPHEARRSAHEPDLHDTCRLPSRRMRQTADREFGRTAEYGVQRALEVRRFLINLLNFHSYFSQFPEKLIYFRIPDL